MTASLLSQRAGFAEELLETMTGSFLLIGTLQFSPNIIIFDNQGSAAIQISVDGGATVWKTFPAGEALVLDLTTNKGTAADYTFDKGTSFYGNGASGDFSIAYIYKK